MYNDIVMCLERKGVSFWTDKKKKIYIIFFGSKNSRNIIFYCIEHEPRVWHGVYILFRLKGMLI